MRRVSAAGINYACEIDYGCVRALMAKVIHIWCERAVGLYGSACVLYLYYINIYIRECRRKGHPRAAGGSMTIN